MSLENRFRVYINGFKAHESKFIQSYNDSLLHCDNQTWFYYDPTILPLVPCTPQRYVSCFFCVCGVFVSRLFVRVHLCTCTLMRVYARVCVCVYARVCVCSATHWH